MEYSLDKSKHEKDRIYSDQIKIFNLWLCYERTLKLVLTSNCILMADVLFEIYITKGTYHHYK